MKQPLLPVLLACCAAAALLAGLGRLPLARADAVLQAPGRSAAQHDAATRPPGALADDGGPSPAIFPPQRIPLSFSHRRHVKELKLTCTTCHEQAKLSRSSKDSLLPKATRCDGCHASDHRDLNGVSRDPAEPMSRCQLCHVGYLPEHGNRVERVVFPAPNLRFDHRAHAERNIGCPQCHGLVENLELATRDQLPRMRGCFRCHQMPEPVRGAARGACSTCHIHKAGIMQTEFPSGRLEPPRWLHNADHGPDWIERHKLVAGADSRFCANCHREDYCTDCHDGRVRPRRVHPNDWLNMHSLSARQNSPSCTSCHQLQSFCVSCHQRAGVAMSGPYANFAKRGRFHPPRSVWTDAPRGAGHHGWEAQRNLNACVSCHTERDCAMCHATARAGGRGAGSGLGFGQGVNPHPLGFRSRCKAALRKNARPCLVCHEQSDPALLECR
ncbi:MAG TPA: cytochrome c3 family protein [Polyangiaceae bacterium]|nr:cytochrome c3 family protein [Polyangiaceae bacterium]